MAVSQFDLEDFVRCELLEICSLKMSGTSSVVGVSCPNSRLDSPEQARAYYRATFSELFQGAGWRLYPGVGFLSSPGLCFRGRTSSFGHFLPMLFKSFFLRLLSTVLSVSLPFI